MKNDLEVNKIFAALLVAGIIAMLAGFVAKQVVAPEHLEKNAVAIEVAEGAGGEGPAKAVGPDPVLALLAAADVARGEKAAKACAACHSFDKGGKNGVGPNLWGVVGAKKDSHAPGFAYSGALGAAGSPTWTYDDLNKFIWKPKAYASGTKMGFVGIKNTDDRAAVIAWLRTLADSPVALPTEADIANEVAELTPPEEGTKMEVAPEAAHNEKPAGH